MAPSLAPGASTDGMSETEQIAKAFRVFDVDKDGKLSKEEIGAWPPPGCALAHQPCTGAHSLPTSQ